MGKLEHGGYEVLILMEYCGGKEGTTFFDTNHQHDDKVFLSFAPFSVSEVLFLSPVPESAQLT